MGITYKDSGVDIDAGDSTVDKIKPFIKDTFNERVLSGIGLFGGFYDAKFDELEHPVLVSSTDGVGTKLIVAFKSGIHDTVGQCLVNHCVNDILCCGARPLFFLDYFATGKLNPDTATDVIKGFAIACKKNGCALIGGETAEMPSMYKEGEYDISGTIVGVVDKKHIINGRKIQKGDVLIGLPSTGLHTNGYSLARAALLKKLDANQYVDELGKSLGESLLEIHRSYLHEVYPLSEESLLKGISHITGGGIMGNTRRIIPEGLEIKLDWDAWEWLPIFKLIHAAGDVSVEEMRRVFNLGIGMILIANRENANTILERLIAINPLLIGEIG